MMHLFINIENSHPAEKKQVTRYLLLHSTEWRNQDEILKSLNEEPVVVVKTLK